MPADGSVEKNGQGLSVTLIQHAQYEVHRAQCRNDQQYAAGRTGTGFRFRRSPGQGAMDDSPPCVKFPNDAEVLKTDLRCLNVQFVSRPTHCDAHAAIETFAQQMRPLGSSTSNGEGRL